MQFNLSVAKTQYNGELKSRYDSVKSTTSTRLNAVLNEFEEAKKIGEDDVFEIFDKVESHSSICEYGYAEQKAIGRKPTLVSTGPALKKISIPLKLHVSYCNPAQIINDLEKKAAQNEVFEYFRGLDYIGRFVVESVEKNIIQEFDSVPYYAELTVSIIEASDDTEDEDYNQQTKKEKTPDGEIKDENNLSAKTPVEKAKYLSKNVLEKLTDNLLDDALGQATSYINSSIGGVLSVLD